MTESIRVLLADDHSILRKGISAFLATRHDIEVVGEAADGEAAVRGALALHPDVIVMDIVMPNMDGVEATRRIRAANPDARVLVLTSFTDDEKVCGAVEAGALGYVLKEAPAEELLQAIRDVHEGKSHLNPALTLRLMRYMAGRAAGSRDALLLTARETDVLKLLAKGLSNREIAARLVITERSTASYVAAILDKLQCENRTQAALFALRRGLAQLDEGDPA
jgi:two-component system, NarL family, response regulator LiaR